MEPRPCRRVTKVVKDVADCQGQGGPDDYGLLLRGDNRSASRGIKHARRILELFRTFPPPKIEVCDAGSGICIGSGQDERHG